MTLTDDPQESIEHVRAQDKTQLKLRYDMGSKLGQGAFGTVRLITEKSSKQLYACKIIKKRPGMAIISQLEREINIMKKVKHANIIQLKEVYETPYKVYIIMEYCNGGELVKSVQATQAISEEDIRTVIRRLSSVIAYLHDCGIVHRDIKPENILLSTSDPNDRYNIKVSDFGLAAFGGSDSTKLMENVCGTPLYMAPEVIAGVDYSQQCDIWSIGIMMGLLLVKYTKEAETALMEMLHEGKIDVKHVVWRDCNRQALSLLDKLLQNDPAQRITAKEILLHPWIRGGDGPGASANVLDMMKAYKAEQRWKKIIYSVIAAYRFNNNVSNTWLSTHTLYRSHLGEPTDKGSNSHVGITIYTSLDNGRGQLYSHSGARSPTNRRKSSMNDRPNLLSTNNKQQHAGHGSADRLSSSAMTYSNFQPSQQHLVSARRNGDGDSIVHKQRNIDRGDAQLQQSRRPSAPFKVSMDMLPLSASNATTRRPQTSPMSSSHALDDNSTGSTRTQLHRYSSQSPSATSPTDRSNHYTHSETGGITTMLSGTGPIGTGNSTLSSTHGSKRRISTKSTSLAASRKPNTLPVDIMLGDLRLSSDNSSSNLKPSLAKRDAQSHRPSMS